MKVGIDVRLWNCSGVGRYIKNLVENIDKIDHENNYVLFALSKDIAEIEKKVPKLKVKIVSSDIHWHSIAEQIKFPKIINDQNLDLMHFTYFSVPVRYSKKFIVTMHDMIPYEFSTGKASALPSPIYRLKRSAYKFIVKRALIKADAVIVPTKAVKNDILKKIPIQDSKIIVTYEGASQFKSSDLAARGFLEKLKLNKGKYYLYVGNVYPHKNIERLLQGFSNFKIKNDDFKIVVCGKRDYFYDRLLKQKESKQINKYFVYLDNPSDAELSILYKNSFAYVSASLMEGFALPALESMSLGVPIVMSDIKVFHEICGNVPLVYFNPNDAFDIADKLLLAASFSSKKIQNHIQLGEVLSRKYSWEKMTKETISIYESSVSLR